MISRTQGISIVPIIHIVSYHTEESIHDTYHRFAEYHQNITFMKLQYAMTRRAVCIRK